jgi:hypothetical protein
MNRSDTRCNLLTQLGDKVLSAPNRHCKLFCCNDLKLHFSAVLARPLNNYEL